MEKVCPFCGAYQNPHYGYTPDYQCGTLMFRDDLPNWEKRTPKCYEAELAQQADLLRRALEILEWFTDLDEAFLGSLGRKKSLEAQVLIPDMEKALEGEK